VTDLVLSSSRVARSFEPLSLVNPVELPMTLSRSCGAGLLIFLIHFGYVSSTHAAEVTPPRSPEHYEHLAHEIFAELIGINSTHAVGSAKAAAALAARFKTAGFPDQDVFVGGPQPDKMNIVVRLHGRGKAKPVLFNAHLDVVEAIRETWSVEPFVLTEKDGFYYGRGTIDIKNEVAILATNLIRLKEENFKPDGDIILVFNTDEEAGGDANGVDWLLKEHRPLVDAALVINQDAGGGEAFNGELLWNTIQTAEKVYATYSLTAYGAGGHSSLPPRDNAILRLAQALTRLGNYQFPVRLSETTRGYLEAAAGRVGGERESAIRTLLRDPSNLNALELLRDTPIVNAQLHSTCPVTLFQGGQSESALPMRAKATIQCRLLPDENPTEVLATLARVIDDPQVEINVVWAPTPSATAAIDKVVFTKVAKVTDEMWPGIKVVPAMSAGASDNVYWRRAGLETFGVCGTFVDTTDIRAHGKDERVAVDAFYHSLEFSYRLMESLSTR
jgi:acetylornithine deacetylase/succinyl-diaminopimelate desuccinylase-like protein